MRFAWLRENDDHNDMQAGKSSQLFSLIRAAYNIIFWIFLIPFFTAVDYGTGFIVFTVIIFVRLLANLYINIRDFKPAQYAGFPFRTP